MQYIAARRPANTLDPFYRGWVLNSTAWFIAIQGDLPALEWLMESYLPDELWLYTVHRDRTCWNTIELCGALDYGHDDATGNLVAVQWLYNEYHAPVEGALVHAQKEGHWDTARWILVNCEVAVRRVEWDGAAASGALSFLNGFKWTLGYREMAS
eukprot:jgi/Phyca11/106498/e_gw1.12.426.1